MREIILIRGLPGSGKTTYSRQIRLEMPEATMHVEADNWFETGDGYEFERTNLSIAHQWCVAHTENAVRKNVIPVVSNTFTLRSECAPYYVIAEKYDIPIRLITMRGEFENIHGTPGEIIDAMKERFVSDEKIKETFKHVDLSLFYGNPYDAYNFFHKYEKVFMI